MMMMENRGKNLQRGSGEWEDTVEIKEKIYNESSSDGK